MDLGWMMDDNSCFIQSKRLIQDPTVPPTGYLVPHVQIPTHRILYILRAVTTGTIAR